MGDESPISCGYCGDGIPSFGIAGPVTHLHCVVNEEIDRENGDIMSLKTDVKLHDRIVLKHNSGSLGMIRAYAMQDKSGLAGGDASFRIGLDWDTIKGVSAMTISLNHWDIWKEDDPSLAAILLSEFLPLEER